MPELPADRAKRAGVATPALIADGPAFPIPRGHLSIAVATGIGSLPLNARNRRSDAVASDGTVS